MKKLLLSLGILLIFCSFLQNNTQIISGKFTLDTTVSLIFSGDIMGHSPQFKAAYNSVNKTYNYDACFKYVKPYIENADFAITNLEVPLAGTPYSGYPNFSSPDALLDGLKNAGYDVILTANNHVADRGKNGLERTINIIKNRELKFAGSYLSTQQRDSVYPLMLETKGFKVAILNYTYGTNQNKVYSPNIVNMLDSSVIISDIRRAKTLNARFIVACVHWGVEYQLRANEEQAKFARLLAREGVDIVIGSHPHVVQNAEYISDNSKQIPVFYSLGNSISNQRKPHTDGGIMVKVYVNTFTGRIEKVSYLPVYVHKGMLDNKYQYHLIPTPDFIKQPTSFSIPSKDSLSLTYFDKQTRQRIDQFHVLDETLNTK